MPPLSLMIKPVSGLCNMRCSYCFYGDEMARREIARFAPMNEDTLHALLRRAFAYADSSVTFAFQGGEPTLAGADFYRRWLRLEREYNARKLTVHHAIQTNGLSVSDELLTVLQEGNFLVGVSVDGTREIHDSRRIDADGHGTWGRVMQTIQALRTNGIPYNILCVVDKQISLNPKQVFDALKPHGYIQFIPCLDALDGTQTADRLDAAAYGRFLCHVFREYERGFREHRFVSVRLFDNWLNMLAGNPPEACGMAGRCLPNFLLESNGNVYPCDFYALDEWLLGNVNESSFFTLAKSPRLQAFCEASYPVSEPCKSCRWFSLCRGGCRREREPFENGLPRPNRLCEGYRLFFDSSYDRMVALAQLPPPPMPKQ